LTLHETAAYVAGRIRAAGGVGSQVFTREAVTLLHERSRGIPRLISVIADNALLSGFAAQQRPVGSSIVREVCKDFDLGEGSLIEQTADTDMESRARDAHQEGLRMLAFESKPAAERPMPQPQPVATRPAAPSSFVQVREPDPAPAYTGLMGTVVPRRRRFSFFNFLRKADESSR
jgi:hypothetical protein